MNDMIGFGQNLNEKLIEMVIITACITNNTLPSHKDYMSMPSPRSNLF